MTKRKSTSTIKLFYDEKGRTLSVWFDDPQKEVVSEEMGGGIVLSKDRKGKIIGFEKLYVKMAKQEGTPSFPSRITSRTFLELHLVERE